MTVVWLDSQHGLARESATMARVFAVDAGTIAEASGPAQAALVDAICREFANV